VGSASNGKKQLRKNMTEVVVAHRIPYVAQASPSNWRDLMTKAQKAFAVEGPAFLNVVSPCVPGWRYESEETIELARLAVDTCYWPLYEVEDGRQYRVTYKPRAKKPLVDWLSKQGRFKHLLRPENAEVLAAMQAEVDAEWEALLRRSES
jgi:pyruvate ferredoxin oxidoreductase beta subunit